MSKAKHIDGRDEEVTTEVFESNHEPTWVCTRLSVCALMIVWLGVLWDS